MWTRPFIGMSRLLTTTKSGPQESDVYRRIVRNLDTGTVMDDCISELVADEKLFRNLPEKRNIRVDLVMKESAKWFWHAGPDMSEVYSPHASPRRQSFGPNRGPNFDRAGHLTSP